jgi:hypothetical protein
MDSRNNNKPPSHIFIIPYRDRENELIDWINNMTIYLDSQLGESVYEVYVVHQNDSKLFNRGALCNIGFLEAKKKYPNGYKDIQYVIHDVDIYPVKVNGKKDIIEYKTIKGEARHPYGVLRPHLGGTLGGICIIQGEDYERVNGMPNYYGWGGEDVSMCRRCIANGVNINETNFIDRRSTDLIIDVESHLTDAKKKVIKATDKLNLRKALTENSAKSINGLNNINHRVISILNLNELNNYYMLNVEFDVI